VRVDHDRIAAWEGHAELVELDHGDPRVADLVTEVMLHWLRRGIAGWRLDVAYAVPPEFWREVIGRVRAEFGDAIFLGEVLHGDYAAIAEAGTLDSVTQYELWKAAWSSLKDANFWELAWALERHDAISARLMVQTFLGNHDVTRIASQVGDAGSVLALVMLLTLPGMPSIYYGDEQGFRGEKGAGAHADDPLRPPLPASPDGLAPQGWWLYRLHQELIGLRRRNPWLARGRVRVVGKDRTWITYETTGADGQVMRVELTLDPEPAARVVLAGGTAFAWPR
jgi:glycosidase